jgi:repressor of nif and glnA expression
MNTSIRLRIKIDVSSKQNLQILKLKGILISRNYTEVIHIADDSEEYTINSFRILPEAKSEIINFISDYINEEELQGIISIVD